MLKIFNKGSANFFVLFCFLLYKERRCWQMEPQLKVDIEDGLEAPEKPSLFNFAIFIFYNKLKNNPIRSLHHVLRIVFCSFFEYIFCRDLSGITMLRIIVNFKSIAILKLLFTKNQWAYPVARSSLVNLVRNP